MFVSCLLKENSASALVGECKRPVKSKVASRKAYRMRIVLNEFMRLVLMHVNRIVYKKEYAKSALC